MAMSRRKDRARTPGLWIATTALPVTGGHPFYQRLNQVLDTHAFDAFVEAQCAPFYAATVGRPSLLPGTYFRLLLIGYFEGIDSERGIAWRTADSLALRGFLGLDLDEAPPEHSTISRTRRLIDLETHRAVFTWILQVLATTDLVKGQTIGIDATTLEANAALRSSVRRDSGETYQEFLTRLAQASGIETPTRAISRAWIGSARRRAVTPTGAIRTTPITHHEDERRAHHLAHKAEHAVDLSGAIVGVVQGADQGDTTTIAELQASDRQGHVTRSANFWPHWRFNHLNPDKSSMPGMITTPSVQMDGREARCLAGLVNHQSLGTRRASYGPRADERRCAGRQPDSPVSDSAKARQVPSAGLLGAPYLESRRYDRSRRGPDGARSIQVIRRLPYMKGGDRRNSPNCRRPSAV